jgi:hypothetical protein
VRDKKKVVEVIRLLIFPSKSKIRISTLVTYESGGVSKKKNSRKREIIEIKLGRASSSLQ